MNERNEKLLKAFAYYLNSNPKAITTNQINKVVAKNVDTKTAFILLLKEYLDLEEDFDYAIIIQEQTKDKYINNSYYKNIKINNKKIGRWTLKMAKYEPYEAFVFNDLETNEYDEMLPQIGYFTTPFYYPAIYENNRLWMSITPNEINTMANDIDLAYGDVLVIGLGLGYFPYMISQSSRVKTITIIDNDVQVITLFKQFILPQILNQEKISIIQEDAFVYLDSLTKHYDYAYIDIWHDPSDGIPLYLKFKEFEKKHPWCSYHYWIEKTMKCYLN